MDGLELTLTKIVRDMRKEQRKENEVVLLIERYMKATVDIIDGEMDTFLYDNSDIFNLPYSALVMKKATTLGVARAMQLIFSIFNIKSELYVLLKGDKGFRSVNYIVMCCVNNNDVIVDPFNSLICDKNFISKSEFYKNGEFLKLEANFFEDNFDLFDEYEVEGRLKNIS